MLVSCEWAPNLFLWGPNRDPNGCGNIPAGSNFSLSLAHNGALNIP